jgi:hypothetical protein
MEIRFYINRNIEKYLLFRLISGGLRAISLVIIWLTLTYYINFGWWGIILLSILGILYVYSEIADFIFKKKLAELCLEGRKWQ